jgi:hypothetical protein
LSAFKIFLFLLGCLCKNVKIIFFATKSKKTADRHSLGGIHDRTLESWANKPYMDVWLINNALGRGQHQKAMAFFIMLSSCEV